jgi:hypothetical protein
MSIAGTPTDAGPGGDLDEPGPSSIHPIWHRIGPERASFAPANIALRSGPNSARNRNTSLIRRIFALGLGTTATPPKKGGTIVAITSTSAAAPSASGRCVPTTHRKAVITIGERRQMLVSLCQPHVGAILTSSPTAQCEESSSHHSAQSGQRCHVRYRAAIRRHRTVSPHPCVGAS